MFAFGKPSLTRQKWLEGLGRRLVWYFPAAQVKEILSDYQEQFDAGREHGKTDAEIIQALGTPEEAAALLLDEEPSARMSGLRQTGLWGAALGLCCAFLWMCLMNSISLGLLWTGVFLGLPLTVSALFLLIRGPARAAVGGLHEGVSVVAVWAVPAALTLAIAVEKAVLYIVSIQVFSKLPEEELDRIARSLRYGNGLFWAGIMLVLALLALWLLYRSASASIQYFPGVIHTFGAIESAFSHWAYFTSIYTEGDVNPMVDTLLRLLPYCAGLATALVFQRWTDGRKPLPRFFRDGEVTWEDWQHRLGVGLLGWYDAAQAIEVLEDYQEQYDLGREQGKSEDALLSEMGRPEAVVRDLLKEDRKARLHRRKIWIWAVAAAVSAWLLLGYVSAFEFGVNRMLYYGLDSWTPGVVALPLGTAALFVLLHTRERAAIERRFPARQKPSIWLLVPPLVCSALTEGLGLQCIYAAPTRWDPIFLGQSLVWCFITFLEFSVLLLVLLLIWTLARCASGSIRHLPAVPLLAGSFTQVVCVGLYLSSMDLDFIRENLSGTVRAFLANLWPLGLGVLLALAVWLVIRAAGKPRKEG